MSFQDKLPRLPIPPLKQTIDRYLESIAPVASGDDSALAETHRRASDFLKVAHRLQQRLVSYDKAQPSSWLEDWWLELAYLSWREGLCINSNYWISYAHDPHAYGLATAPQALLPNSAGYHLGAIWDSKEYGEFQIRRAARFIQRMLDFKERIDQGRVPAERTRAGPLCMNQYNLIFGMTRIPRMGCDVLRQDKATKSSHSVLVIVEDQLYSLEVIDGAGHRKPDGDLETELQAIAADIIQRREAGELDPAVTVLTGGHRDRWSAAYEILEKQPQNSAT
ncbi:hypothetical protein GGI12_005730, partial [Dipsacomyces acuminosporus]